VNTIPICLSHLPLSYITIALAAFPHSGTVLKSIYPLSLIKFAITPSIFAYTLWPSIDILPIISTTVWKLFETESLFVITLPITFIDTLILV
jgi:hypothetical protein